MVQASDFECLVFDPFSFYQDGLTAAEIDVGWCEVCDALVISQVVVVVDEGFDWRPKITWVIVVFKQVVLMGVTGISYTPC